MKWLLSLLLLGLCSLAQAISSSGNRLLVILEDVAEKAKYGKYLADLEGMLSLFMKSSRRGNDGRILIGLLFAERQFSITYETPKSESVSLFTLGARAFDHVVVLPTKSKGSNHIYCYGTLLIKRSTRPEPDSKDSPRLHQCRRQHSPCTLLITAHLFKHHLPAPRARHSPSYRPYLPSCRSFQLRYHLLARTARCHSRPAS
jgi:hypothetical protein